MFSPNEQQVAIVIVGTTHPGNLGASARAMGVMGFSNLLLARPQSDPLDPDATARASGQVEILENCKTFPDLQVAVAKMQKVYAFTSRKRGIEVPVLDVRTAAKHTAKDLAQQKPTAFVFGPEKTGLTNEEIEICDAIVEIPAHSNKSSLNVAFAVQIACYELYLALGLGSNHAKQKRLVAPKEELAGLLEHLEDAISKNCPPRDEALFMKMRSRLRLLINRAKLSSADIRMLRGFLSRLSPFTKDTDQ